MGMRDAHSIPLIVFSGVKKFVNQVCPYFPVLSDVDPSVFAFHVPSMKPTSYLSILTCFSHCIMYILTGFDFATSNPHEVVSNPNARKPSRLCYHSLDLERVFCDIKSNCGAVCCHGTIYGGWFGEIASET